MSAILLILLVLLGPDKQWAQAKEIDFARDILPILSDNCFQCHGPDTNEGRKGDLRLDKEEDTKRLRDSAYKVISEGDPSNSELIKRINSTDSDDEMPPPELGRKLTAQQKSLLSDWIKQGAKWGKHWAFEPVIKPTSHTKSDHPIDSLVVKKLTSKNLTMNQKADRRTLIRRLALDLTGLPPTPNEIQKFLSDSSPNAWEQAVERMLTKESFGERMAWDWLEASRYSDTNGYQGDRERTMWPWRDWVVSAFNENLPYDKFTMWQLAGDLMPNPTRNQILATGFNRNHMINGEGGRIAEENRVDYVFDMTETMGTVWLGLTLNCSRCHDHKFDPIAQKEYYQLTAFFNQTPVNGGGGSGQTAPILEAPTYEQSRKIEALKSEISELDDSIKKRSNFLISNQKEWEKKQLEIQKTTSWEALIPDKAKAKHQELIIQDKGFIYAKGKNPDKDEYVISYPIETDSLTGVKIEAVRHPQMTAGGLARSDSGNFVLTDIEFQLTDGVSKNSRRLQIQSAQATFEQGGHKITNTFDSAPQTGWAVWNGKNLDRDHAAVFTLKPTPLNGTENKLVAVLKFNSPHAKHNLGYFRLLASGAPNPKLDDERSQLVATLKVAPDKRSEDQKKTIREALLKSDAAYQKLSKDKKALNDQIKRISQGIPKVMVMKDRDQSRQTYILERGLYNKPGNPVKANIPSALPQIQKRTNLNRLDLAEWLVRNDNPLTSRVTVNRIWQMFFGTGLVKTAEDFGVQSEYPEHKELLDWLAAEFMDSGWDMKHLIRTIVTSKTYQQSSIAKTKTEYQKDPQNRYLARGPRFRMPSWMIRDQALAASNLLNSAVGGRPVFSYQPKGLWSEATFGKKRYNQDDGEKLHRRSIYTFWRRIVGPPVFFDTAKRQVCEVNPLRTNTPMHALTVYNDITFVEAARSLAEHVISTSDDSKKRLDLIYLRTLGRYPDEKEYQVLEQSLKKSMDAFMKDENAAKEFVSVGAQPRDESLPPKEVAAWAALCLNVLNLDETLTKE